MAHLQSSQHVMQKKVFYNWKIEPFSFIKHSSSGYFREIDPKKSGLQETWNKTTLIPANKNMFQECFANIPITVWQRKIYAPLSM